MTPLLMIAALVRRVVVCFPSLIGAMASLRSFRFGLALALGLGAMAEAAAQTTSGEIEGRVRNGTNGLYLGNARVMVAGTTRDVFTDETGTFRLGGLPAGEVTLEVFFTGLQRREIKVIVPAGSTVRQDVVLTRGGDASADGVVELNPFVIAADREYNAAAIAINEQRFAPSKREVVSTDAFGEINQGNIGEFVKHLPGISFEMKDGNNLSGIMVRGFNSNYTNVTFDGAQMASAALSNTQTHTRQFVLEQANINNIARIEVIKLPTPDVAANLLGGAVNFISRSAFESPSRQIGFSTYFSVNEKAFEFEQTPGPGSGDTYKIRPSFKFNYLEPVNDRFGYVVNLSTNSQYYLQNRAVLGRRYSGSGASVTNPQTNSTATSYGANLQTSNSGSIKFDWKPLDGHTVSFSAEANAFEQMQGTRTLTYNVGNGTPVSWGETFINGSTGASGTGTASLGNSFQQRHGLTRTLKGQWNLDRGLWKAEVGASFSHSASNARDIAKGFFRGMGTSLRDVRTVNYSGVDNETGAIGPIATLNATGGVIDSTVLANYNLGQVQGEPQSAEDTVVQARGKVSRDFDLGRIPVRVSIGGSATELEREIDYALIAWTYAGPNGVLNNGDEGMAAFLDAAAAGTSPGFGRPGVQWPSPYVVYDYFKANPTHFVRTPSNVGDTLRNIAVRSPLVYERISAGYVMGDTRLFNRVRLVGGVRYELTENWGYGFKQDSSAVFQRDANGDLIKVNGAFVRKPEAGAAGSGEDVALVYKYRGQYNERDYDHFFPSLHSTIEIFDGLQLRAAYAETVGRPRIVDIVPSLSVSDNVSFDPNISGSIPGFITSSNTTLKPWTAKNYDFALEYYLPHNGTISFNYFKKDIKDFFSNLSLTADAGLLDQLGLSQDYLGYRYTTRINVSDARIQGWEANVVFPLANIRQLGEWGKHLTVRGNITHLDLSGSRTTPSDFGNYTPRSRNMGLNFSFGRFSGNVLLNYKGKQLRDTSNAFTDAREYIRERSQLDANLAWQLSRRFSVFVAGRNILNDTTEWEVSGPVAPSWAALTNYEDYGAQFSFGVNGKF